MTWSEFDFSSWAGGHVHSDLWAPHNKHLFAVFCNSLEEEGVGSLPWRSRRQALILDLERQESNLDEEADEIECVLPRNGLCFLKRKNRKDTIIERGIIPRRKESM
mmetsp:Transcript_7753/g.14234  ORF Transcript_7753/g.14234 Transcript_7753/m.14234 type:complete len:106 (-) Transcript_7753:902-1219(-)